RSFARMRETNLKKQGMLGLTFANPEDYDKIQPSDKVDILSLDTFDPGKNSTLFLDPVMAFCCADVMILQEIPLAHSFNEGQIEWFKSGSALDLVRLIRMRQAHSLTLSIL
ncbi:hypothetical protein BDR05DRAFT_897104, partial [Suillus weaverae]